MNDEITAIQSIRTTPPTIVVCERCAELDGVMHVVTLCADGLYHHTVTSNARTTELAVIATVDFGLHDGPHIRRTRHELVSTVVDVDTGLVAVPYINVAHQLVLLNPDGDIVADETRIVDR